MHFSDAQSITVSHLNCCSKRGIRDKEWPHEAWWLLGMTFKGRGGILRSSVDVQTIKRTASTALMKSRSIFVYYVRIDRNQVYRDHFELISKKQNRTANANITLQKRTLDELDNNFLGISHFFIHKLKSFLNPISWIRCPWNTLWSIGDISSSCISGLNHDG